MSGSAQTLFNLLPALYRLKDAQIAQSRNLLTPADQARLQVLQGLPTPLPPAQQQELDQLLAKQARGPIESLLMLVEEQLAIVAEDLDQFYDDQFIETCAPWVIPYIGGLIGFKEVHGVAPGVASPRAEVAHTIGFRRRKGTALVLEQLARDITGWGAHAVEFFQKLATTQYMNHVRPDNHFAPDLRRWQAGAYINTGFDRTAHKVDVRRITVERGRYNIQNVGIFLWSLNAYSVTMSPAVTAVPDTCFRFNSLGRDVPLFNQPVSQGADITALAEPVNVPDILRRRLLCQDIAQILAANSSATNYDPGNSLAVFINGSLVPPSKIQVCDLAGNDGSWINLPPASSPFTAAIDPELGRLALPPSAGASPVVQVSYHYGFNADMGGGEYPRSASFAGSPEQVVVRVPGDYPGIQQALTALPGDGIVEITDSGRYAEPAGLTVAVKAHGHIELRAADGRRPTLVIGDDISVTGGVESQFDLNGLIVTYAAPSPPTALPAALVHVPASASNDLSRVGLTHCTLVPGWALNPNGDPQSAFAGLPTLAAEIPGLQVVIRKSIVGGLSNPRAGHRRHIGHHRRCHRSLRRSLRRIHRRHNQAPPTRRRAYHAGLHRHRKSIFRVIQPAFQQHRVGPPFSRRFGRDPAHMERSTLGLPQAGRLRAIQLPAARVHHSAAVRIDRAGSRLAPALVLLAALWRPRLREALARHRRPDPARSGRQRRNGGVPFSPCTLA